MIERGLIGTGGREQCGGLIERFRIVRFVAQDFLKGVQRPAWRLRVLRDVVQIHPSQVEECSDGCWRKRKGFEEICLGGAAISPLRFDDAKQIVETRIRGELFDRRIQLAGRYLRIPLLNHLLEPLEEFARRAIDSGMRKTDHQEPYYANFGFLPPQRLGSLPRAGRIKDQS